MTLDIPAAVRSKASVAGLPEWIDQLPVIVDELCETWGLVAGEPFTDATEAYVCRATRRDGASAVLKIMVPRDQRLYEQEVAVLDAVGGDGCAMLLAREPRHQAMLIERLGPSLHDLGLPVERRHEILADTASRMWRSLPSNDIAGLGVVTGAAKAEWLADTIVRLWEELDRPLAEEAVTHALACAERRRAAHHDERSVLVHGDVHEWNTLQTLDGTGYKLVDPDGLLAEPEYDLGIIMREDPVELMQSHPDDRAHWLAERTGRDWLATREWGVVERVSTGLLCVQIGLEPVGTQMLRAAEYVAGFQGS